MKQLGIIISSLDNNQLAFFSILNANLLIQKEIDCVLFFENTSRPVIKPNVSIMNSSEVWDFCGDVIATTLRSAACLPKLIRARRRIFYLWDLEFLRPYGRNYIPNMELLRNPKIELAARSESHKRAIENYCNKQVSYVIDDCDFSKIMEA